MNFTPSQAAEMLGIPPSTLRLYASKFSEHLSDQGRRKHRLYSGDDLVIFGKIRELASQNIPFNEISTRLSVIDASSTEDDKTDARSISLIPEVSQQIQETKELLRDAIYQVTSLKTAITDQSKLIENLQEENHYQQEQIIQNKKDISELNKIRKSWLYKLLVK